MPPLYWCGRRWLVGADDFVFRGSWISIIHGALLILTLVILGTGTPHNCQHQSAQQTEALFITLILFATIHGLGVLCFGALAVTSAQGSIMEENKRGMVPFFMYLCLILTAFDVGVTGYALHVTFTERLFETCTIAHSNKSAIALVICDVILWTLMSIAMLFTIDPSGRLKTEDLRASETSYINLWESRCRFLCCCFARSHENQEMFAGIAELMASVFDARDLVPSDIAAGMILLNLHQKLLQKERTKDWALPKNDHFRGGSVGPEMRTFTQLSAVQKQQLIDGQYYAKFFLAAYGHLLYIYSHMFCGLPSLCCADPAMCCRSRPGIHFGDCCKCNNTALHVVAGLEDDDILLTSFQNDLLLPAFYVAVDRQSKSVIFAVRGTMSLQDCVTDVVASPSQVPVADLQEPAYAHEGMTKSVQKIISILETNGILSLVVDKNAKYEDHNIVVVGHSLGAGCAAILAILLREKYPQLKPRLRCFAYAPPGGLLSRNLSDYSKTFILSLLLGKDLIPRLAAHTMLEFRDVLIMALESCPANKTKVQCSMCCPVEQDLLQNATVPSELAKRLLSFDSDGLQPVSPLESAAAQALRQKEKMYPPGNICHLVRAAEFPKCCCCGMCCGKPGLYDCSHQFEFYPVWITVDELQHVQSSPLMVADHLPDRLCEVMRFTVDAMNSGELDMFLSQEQPMQQQASTIA